MDFTINETKADEIEMLRDACLALHRHEVAVQTQLGSAPARDDDDYWARYADRFADWFASGNGFCFVAEDSTDSVIGFVFCTEREGLAAYETGERIGYVEEIAVVDSARKLGVGRALMDAARERFRERGYSHFELSTVPGNHAAREFYSRLGLEPAALLMIGDV